MKNLLYYYFTEMQ